MPHKILFCCLLALSASACKKDYNCTCTQTSNNPVTHIYSEQVTVVTYHDTKGNAEGKCKERETNLGAGVSLTASCAIK